MAFVLAVDAEPDGVAFVLFSFVGGGDGFGGDLEADFAEELFKGFVVADGPEGEEAAGLEGGFYFPESSGGVKVVVGFAVEGLGAVVGVEEDGVVKEGGVSTGLSDELLDGADFDLDAGVVEEAGVKLVEVSFVPVNDGGGEFGDGEGGVFLGEGFFAGLEGVAHAESTDEDAGLAGGAEGGAAEATEFLL